MYLNKKLKTGEQSHSSQIRPVEVKKGLRDVAYRCGLKKIKMVNS
jgi:hypothetical protein